MKPKNVKKGLIRVSHTVLQRCSQESVFRSKCPACPNGVLLVCRDQESLAIINLDCCIACGQQVMYTDKYIAGQPVLDKMGKN